jgi:hypothetical protein
MFTIVVVLVVVFGNDVFGNDVCWIACFQPAVAAAVAAVAVAVAKKKHKQLYLPIIIAPDLFYAHT